VTGRLDAHGRELAPVGRVGPAGRSGDGGSLPAPRRPQPGHERSLAAALRARGLDVTVSSEVSPEYREYERTVTTVADSYLAAGCRPTCWAWPTWPARCWS